MHCLAALLSVAALQSPQQQQQQLLTATVATAAVAGAAATTPATQAPTSNIRLLNATSDGGVAATFIDNTSSNININSNTNSNSNEAAAATFYDQQQQQHQQQQAKLQQQKPTTVQFAQISALDKEVGMHHQKQQSAAQWDVMDLYQ